MNKGFKKQMKEEEKTFGFEYSAIPKELKRNLK